MSNSHLDSERPLHSLTNKEFDELKKSGMLWELYPEAPSFYWQIPSVLQQRQKAMRDFAFEHINECDADYEGL